jgi:hypothetical protein
MGLEEIVSKHRERGYRAGPSKDWIKVKNPKSGRVWASDLEPWDFPVLSIARAAARGSSRPRPCTISFSAIAPVRKSIPPLTS